MKHVALIDTSLGKMKIELYASKMPKTVAHFSKLIKSGFYNGLHFHKVINGFIFALGNPHSKDPKAECPDVASPPLPLETPAEHKLSNEPGTIAVCNNAEDNNWEGGTEFFFNCVHNAYLDWFSPGPCKHQVFGRVIEGMDVLHKIEKVKVSGVDQPNEEFVKVNKIILLEMA